jgi:hypothetical protein
MLLSIFFSLLFIFIFCCFRSLIVAKMEDLCIIVPSLNWHKFRLIKIHLLHFHILFYHTVIFLL